MTVASPPPAQPSYPLDLPPCTPGHQLTYTGVAPGGKRLPAPSFHALVEILNPLEHLPVISTIYQAITGDKPSIGEQMAGDALYGGPIGLVSSVVNTMIEGAEKIFEGKGTAVASPAIAAAGAAPSDQAQVAIIAGGRARTLGLAPGAVLAETSETANVAAAPGGGQMQSAIVAGGRAQALGLAPGAVLAQAAATAPAAARPANASAAIDPAPEAKTITTAEATPAAAARDFAALLPTADDAATAAPADPGAISGPLTDTGNFSAPASAPATDKAAPVPLAPPDSASAAPPTAKVAAAADRRTVFMPLQRRGPRFFAVNNAPNHRTFYGMNTVRPASATTTASTATSPATAPAAAQGASRAAAAAPSAVAAALAPALDQPMPPALSPASSLSNPLAPSLSPAALAATEAASAKYSRALDLAQKLKFFYGGQTPTRGLVP